MSVRRAKIVKATIPGPYNILDLRDRESVEICIKGIEEGTAVRETYRYGKPEQIEGPMLRVYTDVETPVLGAPYLDILSGKATMTIKGLWERYKKPIKVKLIAHGVEPEKWYEIQVLGPC